MCEKDEILLKIKISPKSSPRSRDGLRDMKLSESKTCNDGLARSGVWWGGTSKAATTSNVLPTAQVSPLDSSLAEYYGVYNLPGRLLSFIISL